MKFLREAYSSLWAVSWFHLVSLSWICSVTQLFRDSEDFWDCQDSNWLPLAYLYYFTLSSSPNLLPPPSPPQKPEPDSPHPLLHRLQAPFDPQPPPLSIPPQPLLGCLGVFELCFRSRIGREFLEITGCRAVREGIRIVFWNQLVIGCLGPVSFNQERLSEKLFGNGAERKAFRKLGTGFCVF